jgi:AcrR family transcriptional regulator
MEDLPRRERKKAQTRKALLDVALGLIAERGIYTTRVEDITERIDLGKGAFYNYFPSKDALVAALVADGVDVLCREYLAGVADLPSTPDRVAFVVRGHAAFFAAHPVFVVLFHQARGIAKVGARGGDLDRVFADYLARIGDLLVGPADAASTSEEERRHIAAILVGAIAGYRSFRIAAGLPMDDAKLTEALVAGVPATLAKRPSHG